MKISDHHSCRDIKTIYIRNLFYSLKQKKENNQINDYPLFD